MSEGVLLLSTSELNDLYDGVYVEDNYEYEDILLDSVDE